MSKEKYLEEVNNIKEVITNMPQNSKSNLRECKGYLERQLDLFKVRKENITDEIKRRYNIILDKETKDKITIDIAPKRSLLDKISVLNNTNTPYEKIGLDRIVFNINRYYEDDLESLNKEILKAISCFDTVGITLTPDDFFYSGYLKEYIRVLLSKNIEEAKNKLNEIYWKSPSIINQVAMNIVSLYYKYEKKFIAYFNNLKENILKENRKEDLINVYNKLQDSIDSNYYSIYNISKRFIEGEDSIKDFSLDKYKIYIETISTGIATESSLDKLYSSLNEYKMYSKYKYLIDSFIKIYKEKDKYKDGYKNLYKDIIKDEKKIISINKKISFQKKWHKNSSGKIEILLINLNTLILGLKDKYDDLQIQKVNELISKCSDNLNYYDILNIISSYYLYLRKLILDNNTNNEEEIDNYILEIKEFLVSNKLTIINNISILEESNIPNIITNIYRLLNIKIEENEIEDNIDNYLEIIRKIKIVNKINNSDISYDEILFQTEAKPIIDSN